MQTVFHTVEQGEHMSSIAANYGFADYKTLWELPDNAQLRLKRKDPDVLLPGDTISVRQPELRIESKSTEQRHHFQVRGRTVVLRLMLRSYDRQPLANAECDLTLEGRNVRLRTNEEGMLETPIAKTTQNGSLAIAAPGLSDAHFSFKVGHLDPIDEETGWQARLNNLGYWSGDIGTADRMELQSAIEEFQCDFGLVTDGICGPETLGKLKEIHGC